MHCGADLCACVVDGCVQAKMGKGSSLDNTSGALDPERWPKSIVSTRFLAVFWLLPNHEKTVKGR